MAREFSKRVYESRRWRKCAKAYAESKLGICEKCHTAIPHRDDRPENIDDDATVYGWDNLMLLCQECHNAIHARREDGGRRVRFDADGNVVGVVDVDGEA